MLFLPGSLLLGVPGAPDHHQQPWVQTPSTQTAELASLQLTAFRVNMAPLWAKPISGPCAQHSDTVAVPMEGDLDRLQRKPGVPLRFGLGRSSISKLILWNGSILRNDRT